MANRYTQVTPSAYTPLTLEEIALVPAMKRKQHDELAKQLAEAAVKVDPLKEHEAEGLRLKNEMEGKVAGLSEQLASQGISPDTTQKFYSLNKEYRDLTGPMGRVGKINAAKLAEAEAKKKYFEMNSKYYGTEDLQKNWDKERKKYTGFDTTQAELPESQRNIVNMHDVTAPKYYNRDEVIDTVLKGVGHTITTDLKNENAKLVNIGGVLALRSLDGKQVIKTNNKRLQDALSALNQRVQEGQDLRKSQDFQGFSKADDLRYIASRVQAANIYEEQEDLKEGIDIVPAGAGPQDSGASDVINTRETPHNLGKELTFAERVAEEQRLKALIDSGKGTSDDFGKYHLYKGFNSSINKQLAGDKKYKDLKAAWETEKANYIKSSKNKEWATALSEGKVKIDQNYPNGTTKVTVNGKQLSDKDYQAFTQEKAKYDNRGSLAKQRLSDYVESIDDQGTFFTKNYAVLEQEGGTADKASSTIATKMADVFQGLSPTVIESGHSVGRVKGSDGRWVKVDNEDDKTGVTNLLAKHADPKTIKLVDFSAYGSEGKPTVSISFKTEKDSESYNLSGHGDGKGSIGGGETVTLELDLASLSSITQGHDDLETMNVIGAAVAHFEQYGGERGKQFAEQVRSTLKTINR